MTEFACCAEEYDDLVYIQTIPDDAGHYTVIAGVLDGPDIRQHFVRQIGEQALAALQHDVDEAIAHDEDVELVIIAWAAIEGG